MRTPVSVIALLLTAAPAWADFRADYQTVLDDNEKVAQIEKHMIDLDLQGIPWRLRDDKCSLFRTYNDVATTLQQDILAAEAGQTVTPITPPFTEYKLTKDEITWLKMRLIDYQGRARNYEGNC